ncbi:hypothetical protein LXA43DRAFT_1186955 [Ganoderma leucocontextum]|nr:hypothetical protein LXA43DRAFT_1186955 [Ganoderma leucocontextum]
MRFHLSRIAQSLRGKPAHELHGPILPVEIIQRIFVLACEADGAVARSLSVACKTAHSVAKYAARFDTVTLRSGTEREVRRCVSLLSEARVAAATRRDWVARPIVRHLCVLISPTEAWRLMYYTLLRCKAYDDPIPVPHAAFAIRDGLNDAIQVLFLQVAPDLETLCTLRIPGDLHDGMLLPSAIDTILYGRGFGGFPKLRDLLFVGTLWFEPSQDQDNSRTDDEAGDRRSRDPNAPLFPALKRIHIAPCWGISTIPFGRWMKEAPGLESLRVTLSLGKKAGELAFPTPELVRVGSAISQEFSKFGGKCSTISCHHHQAVDVVLGTPNVEPTGPVDHFASRFHFLREVVVVITRSLASPGKDTPKGLGLAPVMVKRLTARKKTKPDPRSTSLWRFSESPRKDSFDATEQYLDRDWRERIADPTGDGIDLYEFSRAFRRNVTVYRTTL